jgi:methyl-accepting chemotaxis protein
LGGEPAYAVSIMHEIASGNLKADVKLRDNDSNSLLATIKLMNSKLAEIIDGIIHGSESISLAANEIAQGNSDLSQRTEEQAASLVQTSSTCSRSRKT